MLYTIFINTKKQYDASEYGLVVLLLIEKYICNFISDNFNKNLEFFIGLDLIHT